MSFGFTEIPAGAKRPFVAIEISTERANQGPAIMPYEGLAIAQKTSAGSSAAGALHILVSADQASLLGGPGSQLHMMALAWFRNTREVPLRALVLADPTGNSATATLTVTGTSTSPGQVYLWIAGERIVAAFPSGSTNEEVAQGLVNAVTARTRLPVTAARVDNVVTLTSKHVGVIGNAIDVRLNHNEGENLPAGTSIAVVAMSGGTGELDFDDFADQVEEAGSNTWIAPFNDATNLGKVKELQNHLFSAMQGRGARGYLARAGTLGELLTFVAGQNNPHEVIVAVRGALEPFWVWGAAMAAQIAHSAKNDPARPVQTLPLIGITAPRKEDRWSDLEVEQLLSGGLATWSVGNDGTVRIMRAVTTYNENVAGAPDEAYLDVENVLTVEYIRFDLVTSVQLNFPRHKWKDDDGVLPPAGQPILTPKGLRSFIIGKFREWNSILFLVQDPDQFEEDIIVEVDPSNSSRANVFFAPRLVQGLRQVGMKMAFML